MKKCGIFRRAAALAVCGALLAGVLSGCGAASSAAGSGSAASIQASQGLFQPGSYTATAAGRNGDVTVTVEFSEDEILSISVDSQETETIGVTAMDTLASQVLASQSLGVDNIAGATLSCEAFLAALADCVEQAGGDVEALRQAPVSEAQSSAVTVTEADVIVVGAGGAGLMAATAAANAGASVILLEKSGMVGGNTLCATMGINAVGSQVQAEQGFEGTLEEFIAQQMNNDEAREELVTALAEASGETIDWLSAQGVQFSIEGGNNDFMLMATADGKTSTTIINAVYKALQATDVTLYLNMDVTDLVTDADGTVVGVTAQGADGAEYTFSGKSIVLCTGGFGQNQELLGEVAPELANAITDEIAPTTGEGLLMAQELGAQVVDLDAIQLFPHVIMGYGLLTPNDLPGGFNPSAIYLNQNGERFVKEGFEVSDAVLAQPDGMAWCIFSENDLNDTLQSLVDNGIILSGDSPAELAEKLGLDPQAVTEAVEAWNAACEAGADEEYGRENLVPLEGTLYGYNFGVGAHYFMGGILIDQNTRVVKTDGSVIPGLYAAGEVTGGFHGTYRVDGSGLADSIVFGRIAGTQAAQDALS